MALVWEHLATEEYAGWLQRTGDVVRRAKVPGGWLISVLARDGVGVTFYPDPEHVWDGSSLP